MISFRKLHKHLTVLSTVIFITFLTNSCRKDEFDEPPLNGVDPGLTVNMTLDSLKKIYKSEMLSGTPVTISDDWTIKGLVVADDRSGNLYKTIVIEDGTAGISIRIDISNFFASYPVGRQVYIKLKGLVMGPYSGLVQLGGYISGNSVEAIPSSLVGQYLIPGTWGNPVIPHSVNMSDLISNTYKWQNRLVSLNQVQFAPGDAGQTYADPVNLSTLNRDLEDCYGSKLIVRTSGYSNFASALTDTGSGSLTAIFSVYITSFSSDEQLIIRDLEDVQLKSNRFVIGTCPPPPSVYSSIADVRSAYSGGPGVCPNVFIRGVVISDYTTNNLNFQNCYVQDNSGGIVVRFAAGHNFELGDSIKVECSGVSLSEFNGLLQIGGSNGSNTPLGYATLLGTGTVTPRVTTIPQIKANLTGTNDPWESTLITLQNATIVGGGTFSGSKLVVVGNDTITMYTTSSATFSGANVPTGNVNITAILSDFKSSSQPTPPNTRQQLILRSPDDIQ